MFREDREPEEQWEHEERVLMGHEPGQDRQDGRGNQQVEEEGSPRHQTIHVKSRYVTKTCHSEPLYCETTV